LRLCPVRSGSVGNIAHFWDASPGLELLEVPVGFVCFTDGGQLWLVWKDEITHGYILDIKELMDLAHTRLTRTWTADECSKFLHTEVCLPKP